MNAFLSFIMGPMVWISAAVFIFGLGLKVYLIVREVRARESFIFSYLTLYHSIRSICAWSIPFFPRSTRNQPVFYGVSYCFHLSLFIVPLFFSGHIVLIDQAFHLSWPALDDMAADILTLVIIGALIFFACRRVIVPDVKYLTSAKDFFLLIIVLMPFLTGFLAYHQVFFYEWIMVAHVLSGELMLIIIPFSRLSHMVTGPLIRAYTGSEFGNVRHARDW